MEGREGGMRKEGEGTKRNVVMQGYNEEERREKKRRGDERRKSVRRGEERGEESQ